MSFPESKKPHARSWRDQFRCPFPPRPERIAVVRGRLVAARIAALLLLGVTAAPAALRWDATEAVLKIDDTQKTGQGRFAFTNTGPGAVDIVLVRPECGCTVALPPKKHYEPGERGEIFVEFHHDGRRKGTLQVPVDVFVAGSEDPARLMFVVEIDSLIALPRRAIFWQAGVPREPRSIRVTLSNHRPARIVAVTSSGSGFVAKLEPIADHPHELDLVVTPPPAGAVDGKIELHAVLGAEQVERTYTILVRTLGDP